MVTDSSLNNLQSSLFNPNSEILENESLYRAIRPWKRYWKRRGVLSPAAFKDKNGLSLDRCGDRDEQKVIDDFRIRKFDGTIISLNASEFRSVNVFLKPEPKYWPYHVLALDSPDVILISDEKCDRLRFLAKTITTL